MNFRNENDISAKCSNPISIGVEILVGANYDSRGNNFSNDSPVISYLSP